MSSFQNGYFTSPTVTGPVNITPTVSITNWSLVNSTNNSVYLTISPSINSATPPVGSNITQFLILQHNNTTSTLGGNNSGIYQDIVFPYTGYGTISFYTEKRPTFPTTNQTITIQLGIYAGSYNYADTNWHLDSFNFIVDNNLTLRLSISSVLTTAAPYDRMSFISGINITFLPYSYPTLYPKIFDNSANAMTANYRNGLIFNSQFLVNNNSSFNSQQNNHSLDFISDQYYGEGYQNMTVAFSSTQNRIPIYRSIVQPATFSRTTNFSASYLNGCFLWLDAADLYTTTRFVGTSVNSWYDKSPINSTLAGVNVVPLIALNALNGYPVVNYNGNKASGVASTIGIGTNSFAMFVVSNFITITDNVNHTVFAKSIYGVSQDGRFGFYKDTTNKIVMFLQHGGVNSPDIVGFPITSTGYNIYSLICNRVAGSDTVYYNGTSKITRSYVSDIATNLTNTNGFFLGVSNSATGNGFLPISTANTFLNGNIAEVMCFRTPTDMTEATRQKIEGYLAWKWGLTANLPLHHPWIYDQPTFGLRS